MKLTSRLEARKKLEDALQEYVDAVGQPGDVATDFIISVAVRNLHLPVNAIHYFHVNSGPLHALAGLKWMQEEELKGLNREEAELDSE